VLSHEAGGKGHLLPLRAQPIGEKEFFVGIADLERKEAAARELISVHGGGRGPLIFF